MKFSTEDKKILLELIGSEQIKMIIEDPEQYASERYIQLEKIKMYVKNL